MASATSNAKNATIAERIAWHLEHAKHCNCRPMPEKLKSEMKKNKTL